MDTTDWSRSLSQLPGTELGEYLIERYLGQGGTAVVFLGSSSAKGDRRQVALKLLNPTMLDLGKERQRLERQLKLKRHECPYLIQPIEFFEATLPTTDGSGCTTLIDVSEYIDGAPLDPKLLPSDRVEPVVAMVAAAAQYLERRGFCHRDIKPDNVLLTRDARRATLLDLGVLHALLPSAENAGLTSAKTNHELVTRRYSSPEICSGTLKPTSSQEDWLAHTFYQLGAIIFEAITESTLFAKWTGDELVAAIVSNDPFAGRTISRCHGLERVARACLSKSPRARLEVKWADFECRRYSRKPTVVFLYCGGTIGAATDPRGEALRPRKIDGLSKLPEEISRRLSTDHLALAPGMPFPLIEWRFLPAQFQVFSENADPTIWNSIVEELTRILAEDWTEKYLAGIVILHGTDTLSYTAAALQLTFPQLPCPIVLTGANNPPSDERDVEESWETSKSDAWSNLLRSIHFLVDGGHRLPMVYIAFANTICHAVNGQKLPLNRMPLRFAAAFRTLAEAFSYRNVELGRRFAYKYIEGVLVNSFLPVLEEAAYFGPPAAGLAPWERATITTPTTEALGSFSTAVGATMTFPCCLGASDDEAGLQLVVAFASGTVGDSARSRLSQSRAVVTQWGLSPHQDSYASGPGKPDSDTKLYRVLPDSALPFLALAHSLNSGDIEAGIADIVTRNRVVKALLGNPLNRGEQRLRADFLHSHATDLNDRAIRSTLFTPVARDWPAKLDSEGKRGSTGSRLIVLRRGHFEALVYGLLAPHLHAGSAAEGYAALFDIGFSTGVSIAAEWRRGVQGGLENRTIEKLLRELAVAILASGLGAVKPEVNVGDLLVEVRVKLRSELCLQDVYSEAWVLDSRSDHQFIDELERGLPLDRSDAEGSAYFENKLRALHGSKHSLRITPIDWYIFGIVKGAVCWFFSKRLAEPLRGASAIRPNFCLRFESGRSNGANTEGVLVFSREVLDGFSTRDTGSER